MSVPVSTVETTPSPNSSGITDVSVSTRDLVTNLYISVPIGVILFIVYCFLRKYYTSSFEIRRKYAEVIAYDENTYGIDLSQERDSADKTTFNIGHPRLSDSFFMWVYEVWTMETTTFFRFAGLDALVFRMYLKGCVWICLASLPYALLVLLPVYGTVPHNQRETSDNLGRLTVSNCPSASWRLYFTVIGAYFSFAVALFYLSKIYLVVAFAADQNYVGNVGNITSLKQIDSMSWTGYFKAVTDVIQFNAEVVGTGLSKVKGAVNSAVDTVVQQATGLFDKKDNEQNKESLVGLSNQNTSNEITEPNQENGDGTALLQKASYGSTDEAKVLIDVDEESEQIFGNIAVPIDKYTVMIRDLPEQFQTEEKLGAFVERLFPNRIFKIFIVYDVRELTEVYERIKTNEQRLRELRKKYGDDAMDNDEPLIEGKCCPCCGESGDAKKFHLDELRVLKEQFMDIKNNLRPSPTAFITFKDLQTACVSITCPIRFGLYPLKIHQAPAPHDLRWQNLKYRTYDLVSNNTLVMFLFGLLLVFWSIPVTAIQALANLKNVLDQIGIKVHSGWLLSWLESWVSVLILDLFLILLPDICGFLTSLERKVSRGKEEIQTMIKYFDCLVVMVLLVTVLAGTAFHSLDEFSKSLSNIFSTLATGLVSISTYFLLYILLNAFIWLPLELFRFQYYFKSKFGLSEANRFEYHKWYGKTMLILLICVVYSVMCPLVWLIGLIYFIFCVVVFSYQLSMAYVPEFETGAAVWPAVYRRLTLTFNLGVVTLIGFLILKEAYIEAAMTVPLFLFNWLGTKVSNSFRKVFRAASITSASEKDKLLISHNNGIESNWNNKYNMAYYPPIMDIDYNNDNNNNNNNRSSISDRNNTNVKPGGSVQGDSYQSR